jgi:hypothetical protein
MTKERPITFTTEMTAAIRESRKTQTRRVVKDPNKHPPSHPMSIHQMQAVYPAAESGFIFWYPDHDGLAEFTKKQYKNGIHCPYGLPGDRLWVRETFWRGYTGYCEPEAGEWTQVATRNIEYIEERHTSGYNRYGHYMRKMPSIFMPRWASRLTLEVMSVRVERLNDITAEDAIAEGILVGPSEGKRYAFSQLWDSINAKRGYGWDVNPWVWVVTFEVVDA